MDSKGRAVGTDRPPPPSPHAPSFAAALARDLDGAHRADEAPRAAEEGRPGQVEESVQARIDERAERVANERTHVDDASEEALAERAEEHRSATEPAARERDQAEANEESRPDAESSSHDADEGRDDPSAPVEVDAASSPSEAGTAPPAVAPESPAIGAAETQAAPVTTAAAATLAGLTTAAGPPTSADPALAAPVVPPGPELVTRAAGAESATSASPAVVSPGEARTVSMRSVTTVEGRPAPTEADLDRADRVLDAIRVRLQPGLRQATLQLQPEELGRVLIRLRLEKGTARAVVRAETSEALAILEKHVPELRAMFEAQGFEGLELDLGLASESREGGEFSSENRGEAATEPAAEARLDGIELARALNELDGLDLWA